MASSINGRHEGKTPLYMKRSRKKAVDIIVNAGGILIWCHYIESENIPDLKNSVNTCAYYYGLGVNILT